MKSACWPSVVETAQPAFCSAHGSPTQPARPAGYVLATLFFSIGLAAAIRRATATEPMSRVWQSKGKEFSWENQKYVEFDKRKTSCKSQRLHKNIYWKKIE
jgi:hypothetical protein